MNAIDRVKQARSLPEIEALEQQLQATNQQISRLEKEVAGMSKALKKHLQQHPLKPSLLGRLLSRL